MTHWLDALLGVILIRYAFPELCLFISEEHNEREWQWWL